MSLLKKVEGFASKKLAGGVAGAAVAITTGSQEAVYITIAYIVTQAVVDCVKAWRGDE